MSANEKQPRSIPNGNPFIWDLVVSDIKERDSFGAKKHGTRLQGFNGRDVLKDAYQEALDLVVYLRQAIFERDNPEQSAEPDEKLPCGCVIGPDGNYASICIEHYKSRRLTGPHK